MAGIIRRQMLTDAEFLTMYEDQAERISLYNLEAQPRGLSARGNVATIWAIDKLSSNARCLLNALAFLDPDAIQDYIMEQILQSKGATTLPYAPSSKYEFNMARGELLERSLIRRNETKGEVWLHRVLQDIVRGTLESSQKRKTFACMVGIVDAVWPKATLDRRHDTSRWSLCQSIYPHILYLRKIYVDYSLSGDADLDIKVATLLNEAGWWQLEKGNSHSSHINRELLDDALQICEQYRDRDVRDLECDTLYSLGAVANETNDGESCYRHNSAFLAIREEMAKEIGRGDLRLGIAYNQMGTGWMMKQDFDKASACFQKAIDTYKLLPDYSKYMLSIPIANLGLAYWLQGYMDAAYSILVEGLRARESMFGLDDHESFRTGRLLHALGNVRNDQGLFEEGESYHQRALASYQAAIGNNHHRTADVCHKVAQHCLRRNDFEKALTLVDQALKVWNADPEAYLPEISRTSFLKAKILYGLNRQQTALHLFKQATDGFSNVTQRRHKKEYHNLSEADFDAIVTFWSK